MKPRIVEPTSLVPPILCILSTVACRPELAAGPGGCGGEAAEPSDAEALQLAVIPPAPADGAPTALRLRVSTNEGELPTAEDVFVFEGEMRSGHLSQLERDEVSMALEERIVPSTRWLEEGALVLAPHRQLEPGTTHAVATGHPEWAGHVVTAEADEPAVLPFVFPPGGKAPTRAWGAWCGNRALVVEPSAISLHPGPVKASIERGVGGVGERCLLVRAASAGVGGLPPPALSASDGRVSARLEPVALTVSEGEPQPTSAVDCEAAEQAALGGCLRVYDDRALWRPPPQPRLWAVTGPEGLDRAFVSDGVSRWLWPLPPSHQGQLTIAAAGAKGKVDVATLPITTGPPRAHLILTEVYANAVGPEPAQEWVEIANDGLAPASLEGWVVADVAGGSTLPAATLPPGGRALVAREDYDESFEYDPMPPEGTLILRVAELGKNGLSNQGEPLELRDPEGRVVSRFPPEPKPKAGASIARTHPLAPDGAPGSFVRTDEPTPGAPNE